jgi:hypothetical protein
MHGAIVENRSVHEVHEDSSTELPKVGTTRQRSNRGKSAFLEMPFSRITSSASVMFSLLDDLIPAMPNIPALIAYLY